MSTIGQLTNTLLNVSRAGLALITGYGVVKVIKGRADEDTRIYRGISYDFGRCRTFFCDYCS